MSIADRVQTYAIEMSAEVRRNWIGFVALGLLMVVSGVLALIWPASATIGTNVILSVLIGVTGVAQMIHAFKTEGWKGAVFEFIVGLAKLVGAAFLFLNPIAGAFAMTIIIAVIFIVSGFAKTALAFAVRPLDGWGWTLLSGLVSLACGIWIFLTVAPSFFVVPGVVVGVTLLFEGFASIGVGLKARALYKRMEDRGLTTAPHDTIAAA